MFTHPRMTKKDRETEREVGGGTFNLKTDTTKNQTKSTKPKMAKISAPI